MSYLLLRRILLSVALALLVFGFIKSDLNGYSLVGHRWGTRQVFYYINTNSVDLSSSATIHALEMAATAWSAQTHADIQLINAGNTSGTSLTLNGRNEVFFRNDTGRAAETYWWYDGSGELVDADIVFHEGGYRLYTGSGCTGQGVYLEDLAIHEFGHALGLGHSTLLGATMYPSMPGYCDTTQLTLELDDKLGIELLYPPVSQVTPPAAPSNLIVSANTLNPTSSLILSWQDRANNEDGYRVDRRANGSSFGYVTQLATNSRSFADSGLSSGTTYSYRVSAYNSGGSSGYSNIASGQTQQQAPSPPPPTTGTNVALASNGAVASASSTGSTGYAAAGSINGDRKGLNWGNGGGWKDGTRNTFPDWLKVQFATSYTINRINVFSLQDNYTSPSNPTGTMTFTKYGLERFDVQYWTGTTWATVPGGAVTGNTLVWRAITFAPITTQRIRVRVRNALASWSRVTEIEAFTSSQ